MEKKRALVPERGFASSAYNFPYVAEQIHERHWEQFCGQPATANISIAREFYANFPDRQNEIVMVRGKRYPVLLLI